MATQPLQKKTRRPKHRHAGAVIFGPRITEKGAVVAEHNAYVFNVAIGVNKKEITRAIEEVYKVKPMSVRIVRTAGKRSFTRGTNRFGRSAESKKAYVYLKKGDSIDIN